MCKPNSVFPFPENATLLGTSVMLAAWLRMADVSVCADVCTLESVHTADGSDSRAGLCVLALSAFCWWDSSQFLSESLVCCLPLFFFLMLLA